MIINVDQTRNELKWIDHQDGKLGYFFDADGKAVLCDYIGETSVLLLPSGLGDAWNWIEVSSCIPDESFQSCKNIKLIVTDCRFDKWFFGHFIFKNCQEMQWVVNLKSYCNDDDGCLSLPENNWTMIDEFSFTTCNFVSKYVKRFDMAFDKNDFNLGIVEQFINALNSEQISECLIELLKYDHLYTGMLLDDYDDAKVIKNAIQHGCNMHALSVVGQCWNSCKQTL